jgi:hypothetical protein
MPTATDYAQNVLSVFYCATDTEYNDGMEWYSRANDLAFELDPNRVDHAAGVIAALSPMMRWEKNVELARLVYTGADYIPCLPANAAKAKAIYNGAAPLDILGGNKVRTFFTNILDPFSDDPAHVTIDKHAIDIARGFISPYVDSYKGIGKRVYAEFAEAYVIAAEECGVRPLQVQAITWVTHKRMKWEAAA